MEIVRGPGTGGLGACSSSDPVTPEHLTAVDELIDRVSANLSASELRLVVDIDHARLGAKAGSSMPPRKSADFLGP